MGSVFVSKFCQLNSYQRLEPQNPAQRHSTNWRRQGYNRANLWIRTRFLGFHHLPSKDNVNRLACPPVNPIQEYV